MQLVLPSKSQTHTDPPGISFLTRDSAREVQGKERECYYLRLLSRVSSSEEKVPLLAPWGVCLCLSAGPSPDSRVLFFFLLPNNFLKGWNLPLFFLSANYRTNTQLQLDRAVPLNLGTNYRSATPGQESQGKGQP